MRQDFVSFLLGGAFHRMAYTSWGDPGLPVLLCVHGLTLSGRDFDVLANALSDRFHVVCPDLPGRGASDWLPGALYEAPSYVQALSHLLARIARPVIWLGTSLGGICGMVVAASAGNPIRRLILNDIGPTIPQAPLLRIRDYIAPPSFADIAALEAYLRLVHAPFGKLTDAQWAATAAHSARTLPDGRLTLHYDPAIAAPMLAAEPQAIDLWQFWNRIEVPVLAIRGEDSDLLSPETFARMARRAQVHTVADAGHAPALMDAATIEVVREFCLG